MKMKSTIQVTTESDIEEQYILEKFPEAVWVNLTGRTMFFLPDNDGNRTEVMEAITEWEERGM